jgi:serine/threonine-protein kinase RsbW
MALSPTHRGVRMSPTLETDGRVSTSKTQSSSGAAFASSHSEFLLQLHLESNPEALCLVRAIVERAAEILKFKEQDTRAIVRSVDEALANVIRHAYRGRDGMPIDVSCRRLSAEKEAEGAYGLEIMLVDSGKAPDPEKFRSRSLDEIRPGGLGLHFIKESMDVVEFKRKNGKNFLRLVKFPSASKPQDKREGD